MFTLKSLVRAALTALVVATSTGAAVASPIYHVSVNTSAYSGAGLLDFSFLGATGATGATATLTNFSGAAGGVFLSDGAVSGSLPGAVMFSNAGVNNELTQSVTFGSMFSFDLEFGGAFTTTAGLFGTTFGVALLNADMSDYVGLAGNVLELALNPRTPSGLASTITVAVFDGVSTAAVAAVAVPEPADWLLTLTGLVFVVYMTRLNGRSNARRRATK
jgi:hypothetical protein